MIIKHKRWFSLLAVICLQSSFSMPVNAADTSENKLLNRIVAVVNDEIVLASDLQIQLNKTVSELKAKHIPIPDTRILAEKVLDSLILKNLQIERAKQRGIIVSDGSVVEQLKKIAAQNNLTLVQLKEALDGQEKNGFINTRDQIHDQMLIQKLREEEVISATQVTEVEIDNFLQRNQLQKNNRLYHLQHIMISLPDGVTLTERNALKKQAQALRTRLIQGEDFNQLAVRHSAGNNALEGGSLGWLSLDSIPTFFTDSVLAMNDNGISDILESPIGFHIIKRVATKDKDSRLVTEYNLYQFILLSDNALSAKKAPDSLITLTQSITSKEKFKELETTYSDLPKALNENSHLGWMTLATMPKYLSTVFDESDSVPEENRTFLPIANEKGWILLYVDGIRDTDLNQGNKRLKAIETIKRQKANETFEIWLRRLKENATIDIRLNQPTANTTGSNSQ